MENVSGVGEWQRFERHADGRTEYREVRQEGIRCHLRWGIVGGNGTAMTVTRDDERDARRHASRKAREYLRKGFTETEAVAGTESARDAGAPGEQGARGKRGADDRPLLGDLPDADGFLPVDGFEAIHRRRPATAAPRAGFHEYLVLGDDGRRAVRFAVGAASHDPEAVAAFLAFLDTRRDLPFDGGSHHKVRLPAPAGRFTHALFRSPALTGSGDARVASAHPVFDCEIGDADTEVLVDARTTGHGAIRLGDWDREPRPVVDLRYAVEPSFHRPARKKFLVFRTDDLRSLLAALPGAAPGSWLEVRSYRGGTRRFTPATAPSYEALLPFLLGTG
ncbi:WGR domain-containing protein [Streptomyces sp. NPDC005012]|uniref:WGR domain-containing protein n=1 Tax=Streptomyces sp. NPDC005012 TaxID=3154558 RepID=UPI0033A3C454